MNERSLVKGEVEYRVAALQEADKNKRGQSFRLTPSFILERGGGTRTRDPDLGKVISTN